MVEVDKHIDETNDNDETTSTEVTIELIDEPEEHDETKEFIPNFDVRLYKETKFSPYEMIRDQQAIAIFRKNYVTKRHADKMTAEVTKKYVADNPSDQYFKEDETYKTVNTGFLSVLKYDSRELGDYLKVNGTLEGFRGAIDSDYWYFDFDSPLGIDDCAGKLVPLLNDLTEHNVMFRLFLSGAHGWHLYLPKQYVVIPESCKKYPITIQNDMLGRHICTKYNLKDDTGLDKNGRPIVKLFLDKGIYTHTCAFRMPFSKNEKSGRIKREYSYKSTQQIAEERKHLLEQNPGMVFKEIVNADHFKPILNNLTVFETLFDSLLQPSSVEPYPMFTLTEDMFIYNIDAKGNATDSSEYKWPMYEKACIYRILNEPDLKGRRHEIALRLISYWKEKLFSEAVTFAHLQDWSNNLEEPLSHSELVHAMKSYNKVKYSLCKDTHCLSFCPMNETCVYNKSRLIKDEDIKNSHDDVAAYKDSLLADKSAWVEMSSIYEGNPIIVKPKDVMSICGGNGAGKSTVLDDILVRSGQFSVFFCYEMNQEQLVGRRAKRYGLNMELPSDVEMYHQITENVITIYNRVPLQRIPDLILKIENDYHRKVRLIGLDYFQIQEVIDEDSARKRMIRSGVDRADFMAGYVPGMLKELNTALIFCGQPKQALEGLGCVPLTSEAFKYGQAVAALSGKMMTIWRPYRSTAYDTIMSMWTVKNRDGEESAMLNYAWSGKQYSIGQLVKTAVKQQAPIQFKQKED